MRRIDSEESSDGTDSVASDHHSSDSSARVERAVAQEDTSSSTSEAVSQAGTRPTSPAAEVAIATTPSVQEVIALHEHEAAERRKVKELEEDRLLEQQEVRRRQEEERRERQAEEERVAEERSRKEEEDRLAAEEEQRRKEEEEKAAAQEKERQAIEEGERTRREEKERQRRMESAFWESLSLEEKDRLMTMLQGIVLFRDQLQRIRSEEQELHSYIEGKDDVCTELRHRAEQADLEARATRERKSRQAEQMRYLDDKRSHCEEASEGVELLRSSQQNLQAELKRLEVQAEPMLSQLSTLRKQLAKSEESAKEHAARLATCKALLPQMVSELKAAQVEELSNLRTSQLEELAKLEVEWTTQVSDLKSYHSEEVRSLRHQIEETTRRCQRMLMERDDAREQLLVRQREGARAQQQCSDARHEVLELSVQVRSTTPGTATPARHLNRSLSASFLDSPYKMSIQDARELDAEALDLRQRCRDLERLCSRMHSLLERGQEACERWRKAGVSMATLEDQGDVLPFELGPA
mmetsp:Transcript_55461/g.112845  ORF Transcript_55461/g.112845 Transcript_55461/m.112845 type:complete len:525 (-) Transcript_55461:88-1662(-)